MKLNLVADYEIGGKHIAAAFSIPANQNLVGLKDYTRLEIPTTDGFAYIAPKFLIMCASRRKAVETERMWDLNYKEQGRLYDYKPIDRHQLIKESEVMA